MKHKTTLSTIILATAATAAYWAFAQANEQSAVNSQTILAAQSARNQSISIKQLLQQEHKRRQPAGQPMLATQTASLTGSYPDGAVNLDENGQVIADKDLHRLFDHYLSARGEMSLADIKHRLLTVSSDFLSLDQLEQVRDLFDDYVAYLAEAEHFALSLSDELDMKDKLLAIQNHREQMLGKSLAEAFFAEEHAYAAWVMAQQAGDASPLTEQQHKWLLQEEAATAFQDVWLENQWLAEAGFSQAAKHQYRTAVYGAITAERLQALESRKQDWQQQLDSYTAQRLQAGDNQAMLARLEGQYDAATLKRLRVWFNHRAEHG
jgi:lipase chaperone LimK